MHAKAACLHADLNNDQFTKINHFLLHGSKKNQCLINGNNFGTGEHNIHK